MHNKWGEKTATHGCGPPDFPRKGARTLIFGTGCFFVRDILRQRALHAKEGWRTLQGL